MRCISHDQAVKQATANAKTFEEVFIVFADTNSVWNCERFSGQTFPHERYFPNGTMQRH